jgi:hypothetical protein
MSQPSFTESSAEGSFFSSLNFNLCRTDLVFGLASSLDFNLLQLLFFFLIQDEFGFLLVFYLVNDLSSLGNS